MDFSKMKNKELKEAIFKKFVEGNATDSSLQLILFQYLLFRTMLPNYFISSCGIKSILPFLKALPRLYYWCCYQLLLVLKYPISLKFLSREQDRRIRFAAAIDFYQRTNGKRFRNMHCVFRYRPGHANHFFCFVR